MSWSDILRKKSNKSMSTHAIGLIEYVLTSEPQTLNEIIEAMFDKGRQYANIKNPQKTTKPTHRIPTRNELKRWLSRQPHIESARFDKWTNEVVTNKKRPNIQLKYWLKK